MHLLPGDPSQARGRQPICMYSFFINPLRLNPLFHLHRISFTTLPLSPDYCSSILILTFVNFATLTKLTTEKKKKKSQEEISGSRGEANFVWKCKNCKRESSASILAAPTAYDASSKPPQKILTFDCRGLEFVEFVPEVC